MVTRRTVLLVLALAGLLLLVPRCSSMLRMQAANQHPLPLESIEETAAKSRLQFPPGSRLVEGEWFGTFNIYGYARVELPPASLQEFLAQSPFHGRFKRCNAPLPDERNPLMGNPHNLGLLERWRLSRVRHSILAGGGELNSPTMPITVFIDVDDPKTPVAYLHWYN